MLKSKKQVIDLYRSLSLWEKLKLYDQELERAHRQWFGFLRLALYRRILKRINRFHRFIEQDFELKLNQLKEAEHYWQNNQNQTTVDKADLINTIELTITQLNQLQNQFKSVVSNNSKSNLKQLDDFFGDLSNAQQ